MTIKNDIKIPLIIFSGFLLFFILIPNNNQGYDSISYSIAARDGGDLFHPHHLLYHLFAFLIYQIFFFTGLGSMKILSLANSVLGAFTLVLIFKILRARTSAYSATVGALMAGCLFSFWYYATSVEVNMPALMFICLALYWLTGKPQNTLNSIMIYIFISAGILFHQLVVLAVIPFLIYDYAQYRSFKKTIKYAFPGLAGGLAIYLIIAFTQAEVKSLGGIYRWLTFYSHLDAWGMLGTANFSAAVWGKLKTLFGGDIIRQAFYTGTWALSVYLYLAVIAIIWLGLIWMIILAAIRLKVKPDKFNFLLLALIVVYNLFAFWWAPADDGFWLYPAVILILFIFPSEYKKRYVRWPALVVTALLITVNLACEFMPASKKSNSFIYQGAKAFERLDLNKNDLVITNFSQIRLAYEYYNKRQVPTTCLMYLEPGPKENVLAAYHDRIEQALQTGRVIMFENEIQPELSRGYLFNRFSPDDYDSIYDRYILYLVPVDSITIHGRNVILYELQAIE